MQNSKVILRRSYVFSFLIFPYLHQIIFTRCSIEILIRAHDLIQVDNFTTPLCEYPLATYFCIEIGIYMTSAGALLEWVQRIQLQPSVLGNGYMHPQFSDILLSWYRFPVQSFNFSFNFELRLSIKSQHFKGKPKVSVNII